MDIKWREVKGSGRPGYIGKHNMCRHVELHVILLKLEYNVDQMKMATVQYAIQTCTSAKESYVNHGMLREEQCREFALNVTHDFNYIHFRPHRMQEH